MFIDKLLSLIVGLLFLMVLSCDGPSGNSANKTITLESKRTLKNNPAFWDYAASSNILQTEIGQLMIEKGEPQTLQLLAEKSVSFHSEALEELKEIVSQYKSIQIPDSLIGADKDLVKEFELLKGEELETRYKAFINSTHKSQLTRYEEALRKADDKKTRDWLIKMIAHLHEKLDQINATDSIQQKATLQ
jgi:putative membrane protein